MKQWAAFLTAGLLWGSSFLWIKIALEEIDPFTLVAFRLFFGCIGLLVFMRLMKQKFPTNKKTIKALVTMAFFNPCLPFVLISWGETRIDSGMAAILNGTVPLFTIITAHLFLDDDKISKERMLGLVLGFFGVVTLVSRNLTERSFFGNIWGQLAVIGAAICYAISVVYSRRSLRGLSPVVQSTCLMLIGDIFAWSMVFFMENPMSVPKLPITWFALSWLGLLGSCVAFLCFFYLLNTWGPTRASLVNYLFPVMGLFLGIIFRGEPVDWHLAVGSGLVISGILVVNWKSFVGLWELWRKKKGAVLETPNPTA